MSVYLKERRIESESRWVSLMSLLRYTPIMGDDRERGRAVAEITTSVKKGSDQMNRRAVKHPDRVSRGGTGEEEVIKTLKD